MGDAGQASRVDYEAKSVERCFCGGSWRGFGGSIFHGGI